MYAYDSIDRLISATRADAFDQSWGLDGLGNFSTCDDDGDSQTRTANAANEITAITGGRITPIYDDAGNMISGPKPSDETTRVHYVFDAWNRLVAVYEDDGDGLFEPGADDASVASHEYDGANRRIEKVVTGGSHVHYFYNEKWQLLEECFVDAQGAIVASNQYVWSPRYIDAPIVRFHDSNGDGDLVDPGDNTRYYTGDANYSVTATIDATTEEIVSRYVYTAYGTATIYDADLTNPAAALTDGPLYCGYLFDTEIGLYHVRNRYYDSSLSAFATRDPIASSTNLYVYCGGNPINLTDPAGLEPVLILRHDGSSRTVNVPSGEDPAEFVQRLYPGAVIHGQQTQQILQSPALRPYLPQAGAPSTAASPEEEIEFWDWVQGGLDAAGVLEPTPFCDLTNGTISLFRGKWFDAGCSAVAMIPYIGDASKIAKYGRKAGKCAAKAAEQLTNLGLKGVDLAGKSYNSGRKALEKAGFVLENTTSTGRKIFRNPRTGAVVTHDSGKALGAAQKPHWTIQDKGGRFYDRSGRSVSGPNPPMVANTFQGSR